MFILHLDVGDLVKLEENLQPAIDKAMRRAAEDLTAQTHAHIVEQVQQKLRSTRETYLEHLGFHQVNDFTWVVDLMPGALFIEEGMPSHSMVDDLLDDSPRPGTKSKGGGQKGRTKTAKDGSRYRVIPFEHSKAKTRQTPAATDLTNTIKNELKRMGAPGIGKLELDGSGKPKTGLVRSFDIMSKPVKTSEGPGQGKGPVGVVKQGPTGIPLLQGVRIYQNEVKDRTTGKSSIKKSIMTFRVVSSKHKGENRWVHPGLEARKFMDEAADWALTQWRDKIGPEILEQLVGSL